MKTVGVVTVSRSDYGIYLPVLRRMLASPMLRTHLYVSGMHLSHRHGMTIDMIEQDGMPIFERIPIPYPDDTPAGISCSLGAGIEGFGRSFSREQPDLLLALGDRFEMFSAVLAALNFGIPVAHIHGGELTLGAIDDALRHAMTKMAHVHFASTEEYGRRIRQLGEEPWRVVVSGAPALDHLSEITLMSREELSKKYGASFDRDPLLVTFHPVTHEYKQTEWQVSQLLAALEEAGRPVVFTAPNADAGSDTIRTMIGQYIETHDMAVMVENFGTSDYMSAMTCSVAMVGNSSSGIIEAPSFQLPVVNIGRRQEGRVRGKNVLDVGHESREIKAAVERAISPDFRHSLMGMENPYRKENASRCIVDHLTKLSIDARLTAKRFIDL